MRALLLVGLLGTAHASPVEVRASIAGQLLFNVLEEGAAGEGVRADVALGSMQKHGRIGVSTLAGAPIESTLFFGHSGGDLVDERTVSAIYIRLGGDYELLLTDEIRLTLGGGLLGARTRVEERGVTHTALAGTWRQTPYVRRDDVLRSGGWFETRMSFLIMGAQYPLALELAVGYEQVNKDGDDLITRASMMAAVGVAMRWN